MPEKLGVIIVNWNSSEDTIRCLETLKLSSFTDYQLVIVDNGSHDSARRKLQEWLLKDCNRELSAIKVVDGDQFTALHFSNRLTLLQSSMNLGYTGGNNLGIHYLLSLSANKKQIYFDRDDNSTSTIDYFFLINDDAVVDASTLSELVRAVIDHPEAGFLGPKVMILEEPDRLLSAGGTLSADYKTGHRGLGELDRGQYDQALEVDYLSGCALLVNCHMIEKIGLLDNDYFAYHEEIDWCYRGRQAGFSCRLVPTARVWHPDTRGRDSESPTVTYYITRNSLLFIRKFHLGRYVLLKRLFPYYRTLMSWTIRPKWRHKRIQRDALANALADFWKHKFGHQNYYRISID